MVPVPLLGPAATTSIAARSVHGPPGSVEALRAICRALGRPAETEGDAIELYQLGCEYAQGYLFGEPMSAMDARRLVGASTSMAAE